MKPGEDLDILCRLSGLIFPRSVQAETIYAKIHPEGCDPVKFIPHCLIFQIQIRHFTPELRFIIPAGITHLIVNIALWLPRKIVIAKIRTFRL